MKYLIALIFVFNISGVSFAEKQRVLDEQQLEDIVESNFIKRDVPLRYYSNILIQLQGVPTKDDSLIFQELVDTLNLLIDKWDVYLIP